MTGDKMIGFLNNVGASVLCGALLLPVAAPVVARGRDLKVLHSFGGSTKDGLNPYAGLIADQSGDMYGTTFGGGSNRCGVHGGGAAFALKK
jgi:hypothetical protein